MMPKKKLKQWISEFPNPLDVRQNPDGSLYLPYDVIVVQLDFLTDGCWSSKNFSHFFFVLPDGRIKISGSIDVDISYGCDGETEYVERTLCGAATFFSTDYSPNEHWAATCKSLCIVNAVQPIGIKFGWGLNPPDFVPVIQVNKPPQKPDKLIQQKYKVAVMEGDEKTQIEILKNYDFTDMEIVLPQNGTNA